MAMPRSMSHPSLIGLLSDDKGDRADGQTEEQRAHEIYILFKKPRQKNDAGRHSGSPSHTQFGKIAQGVFSALAAPAEQIVQSVDKALVKAEYKGYRPAGNAGDAVGQRHTEAVECSQDHNTPISFEG